MVTSADGRAAIDGRSHALGSDTDTLLLTELRTLADAVLIGTGTLRAEGYGRIVGNAERVARREAAGLARDAHRGPALALARPARGTRACSPPPASPCIAYTGSDAEPPDVAADLEVVRLEDPSPAAALADLRARGVRALLCEGGPTLNRALLAAGVVDELFLTLSPLLAGNADAPRIVEGEDLPDPAALQLAWVLRHGDELYLRYRL